MCHATHSFCRLAAAVILIAITIAGCGSSKPGYCTDRANLNNSITGLTSLNVNSGISGLKSQLQMIESHATALVNSAKGDFPNETSAIKSSVDALASSVRALPSNPSASQIASLAGEATSVVNSVKSFSDASSSKCS